MDPARARVLEDVRAAARRRPHGEAPREAPVALRRLPRFTGVHRSAPEPLSP